MCDAHFRAMGSEAHVIIDGAADLLEFAVARIAQLEARWSRFIESSEVSELNRAQGRPVFVSMDTVELLERSWDGRSVGLGWFEPFQLGAIECAGYRQSYENLPGARRLPSEGRRKLEGRSGNEGRSESDAERISEALATIDFGATSEPTSGGRLVSLPDGLRLDPGGLGKGLAADIVTREVIERGGRGAMVNLGGDLRARGNAGGTSAAWPVVIAHPISGATIASVHLHDAAIATSSTLLRTWRHRGQPVHHIIDPHTGDPLPQPPGCVTVASAIAAEGWMAEALATAALCAGGPVDSDDGWMVTVDDAGIVAYGGRLPGSVSSVLDASEVGAEGVDPRSDPDVAPARLQEGSA